MKKKALFIRLDKIGDLIATLPSDELLQNSDVEVHWVIAKGLGFVAQNSVPQRKFSEFAKNFSFEGLRNFRKLIAEIKPDFAVSFQCPWWVNFALWLCRIPIRAGVLSQWHSFLFLNKGLRQRRSLAEQHEAHYNFDLVRNTFASIQTKNSSIILDSSPVLKMRPPESGACRKLGLVKVEPFYVVHPGMAGSARNWPIDFYIELVLRLKATAKVVITGTAMDEAWVAPIRQKFADDPMVIVAQNKLNSSELLEVLAAAKTVFAPSTGVVHLAAALGVKTASAYSPILVQRARRWGPRSQNALVLTPQVDCPQKFKCTKEACIHWDCMRSIPVDEMLK